MVGSNPLMNVVLESTRFRKPSLEADHRCRRMWAAGEVRALPHLQAAQLQAAAHPQQKMPHRLQ